MSNKLIALMTGCVRCGSFKIENEELGLCATCAHTQRRAERQASKVKVVAPVKKVSAKHAKELQDYGILRRQYLQGHPECEVRIEGVCDGHATTVHHCAKRGVNLLREDTFKAACMPCHEYIETKMSAEGRRATGLLTTPTQTI